MLREVLRPSAHLRRVVAAAATLSLAACASGPKGPVVRPIAVQNGDGHIHVNAEGHRVASVALRTGDPLIVSALCAPDGAPVLRVDVAEGRGRDTVDHSAQRSMWIGFGDVEGVDTWAHPEWIRLVRHELSFVAGGALQLRAFLRWSDGEGNALLDEERVLRFSATDRANTVDVDMTFTAPGGGAHFGDTARGLLALRLTEAFTDPARSRASTPERSEAIASALEGEASRWLAVTTRGDDGDAPVTVAVFDHPENVRHPARWLVAADGLVAVNPFATLAFAGETSSRPALTLEPYQQLRLRYRVVVTRGIDDNAADGGASDGSAGLDAPRIESMWRAFAGRAEDGDAGD